MFHAKKPIKMRATVGGKDSERRVMGFEQRRLASATYCSFPLKRVNVEPKGRGSGEDRSLPRVRAFEGPTTVHPQAEASAEASPKLS